jgi:type II secretory pathway predicted ATPase ExeA
MNHTPDELRILTQVAPTMLRLLMAREKRILDKIYGEFRNGQTKFTAMLAEYASVRDQISEINAALRQNDNKGE